MEKRRVQLTVADTPVTLRTDETDEYMRSVAKEVDAQIRGLATPYGPSERPAILTALTLCDRAFRAEREVKRLRGELEETKAALQAETERARVLHASLERLEGRSGTGTAVEFAQHRNPFKREDKPEEGMQSFFEIDRNGSDQNE